MWSELDDDKKKNLFEAVKNNLIACEMNVPTEKTIEKRVRTYYINRRSTEVIKSDLEKHKKRKLDTKRNRLTYVGWIK